MAMDRLFSDSHLRDKGPPIMGHQYQVKSSQVESSRALLSFCYMCGRQCWARYFKKVLVIVTSYFSQIVTELVTELHHYKSN